MVDSISPELKKATRNLRKVRNSKPEAESGVDYCLWCERMADALEDLSVVLIFWEDSEKAKYEAELYRAKARSGGAD